MCIIGIFVDTKFRRVNILLGEEQYKRVQTEKLGLSGFVRDLIDDHFSERRIVLRVSPEVRNYYDRVISNFGATDEELERFLVQALDALLQDKTRAIESLRKKMRQDK
jgi:hypothetical protein